MGDRLHPASDGQVKVRKTRASKPKVKTGCQTCKIRRVKCDETKPACLRCVKFGHQCDGYVNKIPIKPVSGSPTSASRILVPKSLSPTDHGDRAYHEGAGSPRLQNDGVTGANVMPKLYPAPAPEEREREAGYGRERQHSVQQVSRLVLIRDRQGEAEAFEKFCTATIPPASASYSVSRHTWNHVVSRACHESEDISKAVVVLGSYTSATAAEWSSVGTLRHFKEYTNTCSVPQGWGHKREHSEDTNMLPSWRDQEEEETGSLGREVVVGLRALRGWAYKMQIDQRGGEFEKLAKSLETRSLLFALQLSCRERGKGSPGRGSGDEMEM